MKALILGVIGALSLQAGIAVAAPIPPKTQGNTIVLPLTSEADTSDTISSEATQALLVELRKDGFAVVGVDPMAREGKVCLSHAQGSAGACAALASASGARYAFAGSIYAYSYMSHANLPIRMSVTLFDVRSGQPVWTGAYGNGPHGDFSRAVSNYGDVQMGARTLANALIADPAAANLLARHD